MRRTAFAVAALVVAVALCAPLIGRAAPSLQGDGEALVFLPLSLRGIAVEDLPTAPVVVPTATRTPTPTATATIYVPPTFTPEPTVTATPELGATVTGRLTLDGEPLDEGLGDGLGPGLFLQKCPAVGSCTFVARTAVDADGRYTFRVTEPLAEGEAYQVVWWNASEIVQDYELIGDSFWLGRWFGPRIEELAPDEVVEIPDVELADIKLTSPTHGTGFGGAIQIPFAWTRWAGTGGTYRWHLCRCCQTTDQRDGSYLYSTGTQTGFTLTAIPPGFGYDERYCWYVEVDMGPGRGHGESFFIRMLWFFRFQGVGGGFTAIRSDPVDTATGAPHGGSCPR